MQSSTAKRYLTWNSRPRSIPLRLPIELCEAVIDMVVTGEPIADIRTLRNCALVCKAWRIRAQTRLFQSIISRARASLYDLSDFLLHSQFSRHVRKVTLMSSLLHSANSPFALFPSALQGRLPNLEELHIVHVPQASMTEEKHLPSVPLNQHCFIRLSSFTTITVLRLERTTFTNFGDFAQTVKSLQKLDTLICANVTWRTLSALPRYMSLAPETRPSARKDGNNLRDLWACISCLSSLH